MRTIIRWGNFSMVLALLALVAVAPTAAHAQVPLAGTTCDSSCYVGDAAPGTFDDGVGIIGICGSTFNQTGQVEASAGYTANISNAFYVGSATAGTSGTNGISASSSITDYYSGNGGSVTVSADCSGDESGSQFDASDPGDCYASGIGEYSS